MRMILVATLTIHPGKLALFREYEARAARIMAEHGGAIERAVYVPAARDGEPEREVHIVTFPDAAAFAAYRAAPALAALAAMRAEAVMGTEVLVGEEGPGYRGE